MAALIARKTAYEASADIAITDTPATISFSYDPAVEMYPSRLQALIDRKDSSGSYKLERVLTGEEGSVTIYGPGTYRVRKPATLNAIGIDQD